MSKSLVKLPVQAVQHGVNSFFAGMLREKISQATSSGAESNPATAALCGKHPIPSASQGSILKGNGEAVAAAKGKRSANDHSLPSTRNNGPIEGIGVENAAEIVSRPPVAKTEKSTFGEAMIRNRPQPVMVSFLREDALHPLTGPAGMKSVSLNEKMESIEEPKTATPLAMEMMNQAKAIAASGENVPHAEPPPMQNVTEAVAVLNESGAVPFAKAIKPQGMEHLEKEAEEPPTGKPILKDAPAFISREFHPQSAGHSDLRSSVEWADRPTEPAFKQQVAETLQREKGVAAPEGVPAKNPAASGPATPAASVSGEVRPQSAGHADLRSSVKWADRRMEPAFKQQAAETLQREKGVAAPEGAPAKNPAASGPATPAASVSGEVRPQFAGHADLHSSVEGADRRTEPAPMERVAETLQQEKGVAAPEGVPAKNPAASAPAAPAASVSGEVRPQFAGHADLRSSVEGTNRRKEPASIERAVEILQRGKEGAAPDRASLDVRQASLSRDDHPKGAGESKEWVGVAAAFYKPVSTVGNGDAAIGQAMPERMAAEGSSDKIFSINDTVMETPGPSHDHSQSHHTIPHHQTKLADRDIFPFRLEMPNVVSSQETRIPATIGTSGMDMQAVIDHVLEARQGANSDFGRIRILLNPPDLGAIDLDIVVRREGVQVVMTADNATIQQALQSRSDDIRMALHRHDLKMEGFQVLLQDNGTNQQQANNGAMYREDRERRERFDINEDGQPAIPVLSAIAAEKMTAGRVSIFA